MLTDRDREYARDVVGLAHGGWGGAAPNPMVGAVVVRDGRVVGRGFHAEYGGPHAESVALDDAGDAGRGATLFCSLEPCCYRAPEKHQPPCTDRIIAAGVSRVVINQIDPNPRVSGRGIEMLREAGIDVELIENDDSAWRLNDAFNTAVTLGRPFVHLKMAQSLDGRTATAGGESMWITGEAARAEAHRLRQGRDAVLLGVGTVKADNPRLDVRLPARPGATPASAGGRQPLPVVIDPTLRMDLASRLSTERAEELVVVADTRAPEEKRRKLEARGIRVLTIPRGDDGIPVEALLGGLWKLEIRSVLVEGGSRVHGYFLRSGIFDRVTVFVSPRFLGASGLATVDCLDIAILDQAPPLEQVSVAPLGEDIVVDGYRAGWLEETRRKTEQRAKEVHHVHRVG
ncbi:MAG: bifunctional diaminohydroxyphosphoribosylaminopyrimidine deaminase/5-amino-6-(5-phosphoribosylamino)uracil reductase RibD [Spirochaetaceae bacterium]